MSTGKEEPSALASAEWAVAEGAAGGAASNWVGLAAAGPGGTAVGAAAGGTSDAAVAGFCALLWLSAAARLGGAIMDSDGAAGLENMKRPQRL
jgi:hypothetical protein